MKDGSVTVHVIWKTQIDCVGIWFIEDLLSVVDMYLLNNLFYYTPVLCCND